MKLKLGKSAIQKNLIANFFGIGVLLLNQIILIPLYLTFWDINLYSDWIVISAISSFFSISDMGLNSVTANRFSISFAEEKMEECRSLLTNNYVIIVIVALLASTGSIVYVSTVDIVSTLGLHALEHDQASYVFVMLILHIFLGMFSSVPDAIYRSQSLNHRAVYLNNIARLAESLIILFSLIFSVNIETMVTAYLVPRLMIYSYKEYRVRRLFAYRFRLFDTNWLLLKEIMTPSLTFMFFPVGNAIVYQGFTLIVNKFFGADSVVLYNTTRTLISFMRQLLSTMQQAVWPEYSIAYGKGDIIRMRALHRKAFAVATIGAVVLSIGLLLLGPYVYAIWTNDKVTFNFSLTFAFLVVLIVENSWTSSSVSLKATNNHSRIGIAYILLAVVALSVAISSTYMWSSLPFLVYCLLLIHIPLSFYAIKKGLEMTQDTLGGLARSVLKIKEILR